MEQQEYLIDTNIIIDYLGKNLPKKGMSFLNDVIDEIPNASIISKMEVLGFNAKKDHHQLLVSFMNDTNVFNLTDEIVDETIRIRKNHKTKLPDAIIAATAIVLDFTLLTRNVSDFKSIPKLRIINPHVI